MHELAIARQLLDLTLQHAEKSRAIRVHEINVVIGQLSSFIDESIQFYWDMLSAGTLAEGAVLTFTHIPMELSCTECHYCYSPRELAQCCPRCKAPHLKVTGGDQCYLESIQIDSQAESQMERS